MTEQQSGDGVLTASTSPLEQTPGASRPSLLASFTQSAPLMLVTRQRKHIVRQRVAPCQDNMSDRGRAGVGDQVKGSNQLGKQYL